MHSLFSGCICHHSCRNDASVTLRSTLLEGVKHDAMITGTDQSAVVSVSDTATVTIADKWCVRPGS